MLKLGRVVDRYVHAKELSAHTPGSTRGSGATAPLPLLNLMFQQLQLEWEDHDKIRAKIGVHFST